MHAFRSIVNAPQRTRKERMDDICSVAGWQTQVFPDRLSCEGVLELLKWFELSISIAT